MRVAPVIELTEREMNILKTWSRAGKTPARLMKRAKIIVLAVSEQVTLLTSWTKSFWIRKRVAERCC